MASKTHEYVAKEGSRDLFCCRAPHGAHGLKQLADTDIKSIIRRAPHGARGLKQKGADPHLIDECRAPHGARGLKQIHQPGLCGAARRAPHGARGLKHVVESAKIKE